MCAFVEKSIIKRHDFTDTLAGDCFFQTCCVWPPYYSQIILPMSLTRSKLLIKNYLIVVRPLAERTRRNSTLRTDTKNNFVGIRLDQMTFTKYGASDVTTSRLFMTVDAETGWLNIFLGFCDLKNEKARNWLRKLYITQIIFWVERSNTCVSFHLKLGQVSHKGQISGARRLRHLHGAR